MPYEIGKVFSDAVLGSIERARDRAAAHPGSFSRTRAPRDTSLDRALVGAAQDERENQVRRELGLAEIGANRDRYGRQADLEAQDLQRKMAADADLAGYREGSLALAADRADETAAYHGGLLATRQDEADARAQRYSERGAYERGVLGVRQQEAAADAVRAQAAQEATALRAAAETVRSVQSARALLLRARDLATRVDPQTGKVDPTRAAAFIPVIRDLEGFLRDPAGKNLPADVSVDARKARAGVAAAAGLGSVDGEDDVDPLLDLGLDGDDEDTPPRFGR